MAFNPGVQKEKLRGIFKTQFTVEFSLTGTIWDVASLLVTLGMYAVASSSSAVS